MQYFNNNNSCFIEDLVNTFGPNSIPSKLELVPEYSNDFLNCYRDYQPTVKNYMDNDEQASVKEIYIDEPLHYLGDRVGKKVKIEDDCASTDFSIKEEASGVDQTTNTSFCAPILAEETVISKIIPKPNPINLSLSFRKNSLKFCRRLSKSVLLALSNNESPIPANQVLQAVFKLVKTQIATQQLRVRDEDAFVQYHHKLLTKIWGRYKNIFSNYKNNKICLVTFDEWQTVFSAEGFNKELKSVTNGGKELSKLIDFSDKTNDKELFMAYYKSILFAAHRTLINIIIFEELVHDEEFMQKAPNAEDFGLMTNYSWMYRHYNHSKGKFAQECCKRCKICRSSSLPADFAEKLARARVSIQGVKSQCKLLTHINENLGEAEDQIMSMFSALMYGN